MTDDEFMSKFERCTLDRKEWTHEAHRPSQIPDRERRFYKLSAAQRVRNQS